MTGAALALPGLALAAALLVRPWRLLRGGRFWSDDLCLGKPVPARVRASRRRP